MNINVVPLAQFVNFCVDFLHSLFCKDFMGQKILRFIFGLFGPWQTVRQKDSYE